MGYIGNNRATQLVDWIAEKFAKQSDMTEVESSVSTVEGKISDRASDRNKVLSADEIHELIQRNAAAVIGANASLSAGFDLQSAQFSQIIPDKTCLETGPWYKMHDGVVVKCGEVTSPGDIVYVEENDVATVLDDETLFFFYAHGIKYQRIKTGGGWGNINLPDGRSVPLGFDPGASNKGVLPYPAVYVVDDSQYHESLHGNKPITFIGYIHQIPARVNVIQEFEDCASLADVKAVLDGGGQPIAKYDLVFPSSIYVCVKAQDDDSSPIWSLNYSINNFTFSGEQMDAINSGATIEKIDSIADKIEKVDSAVSGNIATFDENGGVVDSGKTPSDFSTCKNIVDGTGTSNGSARMINTSSTLGSYAFAEGNGTTASGTASHAEGIYSSASGEYSHAEGNGADASGNASHAEGYDSKSSGNYSHAEGLSTEAKHKSQHVFGEYNIIDASTASKNERGTYVEIVGNGTSVDKVTTRSNARTLDWEGNEVLAGTITANGVNLNTAKADKVTNAVAGHIASLDADGNITDSGKTADDFAVTSDLMLTNNTRKGFVKGKTHWVDGMTLINSTAVSSEEATSVEFEYTNPGYGKAFYFECDTDNGIVYTVNQDNRPFIRYPLGNGIIYYSWVGNTCTLNCAATQSLTYCKLYEITSYHKIDEGFLPDSALQNSDWDASEGEPGYVENRTHYGHESETVVVETKEYDITTTSGMAFYVFSDDEFTGGIPVIGDTYIATVGDNEYTLVAKKYESSDTEGVVITNEDSSIDQEDYIFGFLCLNYNGSDVYGFEADFGMESNKTLGLKHVCITADKQLDEAYIPDTIMRKSDVVDSDWNAVIGETPHILNRTHFMVKDSENPITSFSVNKTLSEYEISGITPSDFDDLENGMWYVVELSTESKKLSINTLCTVSSDETPGSELIYNLSAKSEDLEYLSDDSLSITRQGDTVEFVFYNEGILLLEGTVSIYNAYVRKLPSEYIPINEYSDYIYINQDNELDVDVPYSDWYAADGELGHILNRTHYVVDNGTSYGDADNVTFEVSGSVGTASFNVVVPEGESVGSDNIHEFYLYINNEYYHATRFEAAYGHTSMIFGDNDKFVISVSSSTITANGVQAGYSASHIEIFRSMTIKKINEMYLPDSVASKSYVDKKAISYLYKDSSSTHDTSLKTMQGSLGSGSKPGDANTVLGANSIVMSSDKTNINGDYSTALSSKNITNNSVYTSIASSSNINSYVDVENTFIAASANIINTGSSYSAIIGCKSGLLGGYGTAGVTTESGHECNVLAGLSLAEGSDTKPYLFNVIGDCNLSAASGFSSGSYPGGCTALVGNYNVFIGNDYVGPYYTSGGAHGNGNFILGCESKNANWSYVNIYGDKNLVFGNKATVKTGSTSFTSNNNIILTPNGVTMQDADSNLIVGTNSTSMYIYNADFNAVIASSSTTIGSTTSSDKTILNASISSEFASIVSGKCNTSISSYGYIVEDEDTLESNYSNYNTAISSNWVFQYKGGNNNTAISSNYAYFGDKEAGYSSYCTSISSQSVKFVNGAYRCTSIGCVDVTLSKGITAIGVLEATVLDNTHALDIDYGSVVMDNLYVLKTIKSRFGGEIALHAYADNSEDVKKQGTISFTADGAETGGDIVFNTNGSKSSGKVVFNVGANMTSTNLSGGKFIVNCQPGASGTSLIQLNAERIDMYDSNGVGFGVINGTANIKGPMSGGFKSLSTTLCTPDKVYSPAAAVSAANIIIDDDGCTDSLDYTFKGIFTASTDASMPAKTKNNNSITWYGDYGIEVGKVYEFNLMKTNMGYVGIITKLEL